MALPGASGNKNRSAKNPYFTRVYGLEKIDFDNQMITYSEAEIIEKIPVALGLRIMPVATLAATCYQSL